MKKFSIIFVLLLSQISLAQEPLIKESTTTYFFVRHAEKDLSNPNNRDPQLTEEGKKRAQNWSRILAEVTIDMVFTTDYHRTRQTAQPIAEHQNVTVSLYDPQHLNSIDFQEKTKGKTCIVVGHSNTTPAFVNKIIGVEKYNPIDEKEYGKLYIVKIKDGVITDTILDIN